MIALLSIVMLGERVRRAQWRAIGVGFVGVLIVLKPETSGFGWWGTLAVLGTAVCYSVSSVHGENSRPHRQHAVDDVLDDRHAGDSGRRCWRGRDGQPIAAEHYPILAGVALTGAIGQWGITVAFKHAPAASVAPLEYTGLAWVMVIDLAVWSAVPACARC